MVYEDGLRNIVRNYLKLSTLNQPFLSYSEGRFSVVSLWRSQTGLGRRLIVLRNAFLTKRGRASRGQSTSSSSIDVIEAF
jgi:hypothetical protein